MRYRLRTEVDAIRYLTDESNHVEVMTFCDGERPWDDPRIVLSNGELEAWPGDWIIKTGTVYEVRRHEDFTRMYEEAR